jgi:hypothetical protein
MIENEKQEWVARAESMLEIVTPHIQSEIGELQKFYDHTMAVIDTLPAGDDKLRMIQLCSNVKNKMSEASDKLRGYLELVQNLKATRAAKLSLEKVVKLFSDAA